MTNGDEMTTARDDSTYGSTHPANASDGARPRRSGAWTAAAGFVAVLVAAALLLAAFSKAATPNPDKIVDLSGLPLLGAGGLGLGEAKLDWVIAAGEMVIVVALLLGFRLRLAWAGVAVLFGGLTGYVLHAMVGDRSCGCFGDLIAIPSWVSLTMDIGFVVLALGLLAWRRTYAGLIVAVAALAVANGFVGYRFAAWSTDAALERKEAKVKQEQDEAGATASEVLLASERLAHIREAPEGGPAWYVFVYDPSCGVCEDLLLGFFEPMQAEFEAQPEPTLRIELVNKEDLSATVGIDPWAWPQSPTAFVVRDGVITNRYGGEATPTPDQIDFALQAGLLDPTFDPERAANFEQEWWGPDWEGMSPYGPDDAGE